MASTDPRGASRRDPEPEPLPSVDGTSGAPEPTASPLAEAEAPAPEAVDVEALGKRARFGVVLLAIRTVILQIAVFGGQIVLARVLDPKDFGVFAIAQFALSFFAFFGDAGLGGALIQRRGKPTDRELSSVFWAQGLLSLAIFLGAVLAAPAMPLIWKDLPEGSAWLLRALSLGMLFTTLRVVPAILMERDLQFGRLTALDTVISLTFYALAPLLAWLGWGVWALVTAVLGQGVVGLVLAIALRPWKPQLVMDRELLRPIVKYGVTFQAKNFIGFVNGSISPLYAGSRLGAAPVGYINWGQNTAYFPLKLVEIIGRVTFPVFAKLQDDKETFAETLGRALQVCALGTLFFVGLFFGLGGPIIEVVFKGKWLPALPILHLFAGAIAIGFVSPVVGAALDAAGRPGIFARLSLAWTALNWTVVAFTTPRWGMIGFAAGYCVHVVVGNLAVLWVMRTVVPGVRPLRRFWSSALGGACVWLAARALAPWVHGSVVASAAAGWGALAASIAGLVALFIAVVLLVDRRGVAEALRILPGRKPEPSAVG